MDSPLLTLMPYAVKLEKLNRFYEIKVGHFNNGRHIGYIDLNFDFQRETQFSCAVSEVIRAIGADHPFEVLHDNSFDEQERCTYSTIRLMLWDDINLDTPELHEWEKTAKSLPRLSSPSTK